MARVSTRSNPTGLKEIDKGRVSISVSEVAGQWFFSLTRLDLVNLELDGDQRIICIARAGKTSQRFDMGTVDAWKKNSLPLDGLDRAESLRFRIIIHKENSPRLTAAAENLRPFDESQSESLLPMEPAELGQLLWRLDINEEGPVLIFNSSVFPSAAGVENYLPFGALVLPEALRRVMETIADEPEKLSDETDSLSAWDPWLKALGMADVPDDGEDKKREWCNGVVDAFCARHLFAARLAQQLSGGGLEQ